MSLTVAWRLWPMSPDTEYQRRRYTLTLLDDRSSERVERVLTGVSSRLRGELLRNLIITGSGPAYDRTGAAASAGQYAGTARHGQRAAGSGPADGRYGWRESGCSTGETSRACCTGNR